METTKLDPRRKTAAELVYIKEEEDPEFDELDLPPNDRPGSWYIVHTMSGAENRVKDNLAELINFKDRSKGTVFEVAVPKEEIIEIRQNQKVVTSRKLFPGYVFLRCDMKEKSWASIRETPGVVGFVGQANPADDPQPLHPEEVDRFLRIAAGDKVMHRARPRLTYELGDPVRVKEGPFADFTGEIIEINEDHLKVKVLVNIFGRETPVELEFSQVAKM